MYDSLTCMRRSVLLLLWYWRFRFSNILLRSELHEFGFHVVVFYLAVWCFCFLNSNTYWRIRLHTFSRTTKTRKSKMKKKNEDREKRRQNKTRTKKISTQPSIGHSGRSELFFISLRKWHYCPHFISSSFFCPHFFSSFLDFLIFFVFIFRCYHE